MPTRHFIVVAAASVGGPEMFADRTPVTSFSGADEKALAAYEAAVEAVTDFGHHQDALDAALDRCADFAVGHAYAAFISGLLGQDGRVRQSAHAASTTSRVSSRRERQLVEILVLSANGNRHRAAGLAAEHLLEFPVDVDALAAIVKWFDDRATVALAPERSSSSH